MIEKINEETRGAIIQKSPRSLPDNPTLHGLKPAAIKEKLHSYVTDAEASVVAEINRIVDAANTDFTAVLAEVVRTGDTAAAALATAKSQLEAGVEALKSELLATLAAHDENSGAHVNLTQVLHGYIAEQLRPIQTLLQSDDTTLDELQEVVDYIKNNHSLIEGVTSAKVSKTDIADNLTTVSADKPLSARQGNVLNSEINRVKTDQAHFESKYDQRVLEVNVALSQKANAADVYTKAQVDAKIAEGGGGSGGGTITAEREDILAESTREDAAFSYDGTAWKFTFPLKFRELPKSGDKLTFELEYDKGGGNQTVTACAVVRNVMIMTIFATDVANGAPTVYCDANYALGELAMLPEYEIKAWNQKTGTEMSGGWQYPVEDIKYRAYRLIGDSASQIMNIDVDKIEAFMRANIGKFLMGSEEITEASIEAFMSEIRQQGYGNVCVLHQSFGSNPPRYRENETVLKPRAALVYEVEKGYSTTESPINEYLTIKHIWRN